MRLFLECALLVRAELPEDGVSLCSLISLADRFDCPSLQRRLIDHLGTNTMFIDAAPEMKMALLLTTDKYRDCLGNLDICIRLCANLTHADVSVFRDQISNGAFRMLNTVITKAEKATKQFNRRPDHRCPQNQGPPMTKYDQTVTLMEFGTANQVEVWKCSGYQRMKFRDTLTFDRVKEFELIGNSNILLI